MTLDLLGASTASYHALNNNREASMWCKLATTLVVAVGAVGAQSAMAADIPARMPAKAPAIVVAQNWSGVYVGATVGGVWGRARDTVNDPTFLAGFDGLGIADNKPSGVIAGGTLGANWQTGSIVLGVEGDGSWTNAHDSSILLAPFNPATTMDVREQWLATARGRLGVAYDRWLFYVTGGAAWSGVKQSLINPALGILTDTKTLTGWTAGGGVEAMLWGNWSAKVEYLYVDFGHKDYFTPFATTLVGVDSLDLKNHIVRAGLNYRFAPVLR